MKTHLLYPVLLILATLALPGCGLDTPAPKLVPVRGRVVFKDGRPLPGATVDFHPDKMREGGNARGTTAEDGTFTLETYPHGPGAMPGHYKVTFMHYTRSVNIPRKYTKITLTPLTADVHEGPGEDLTFTLDNP